MCVFSAIIVGTSNVSFITLTYCQKTQMTLEELKVEEILQFSKSCGKTVKSYWKSLTVIELKTFYERQM